MAVDLLRDSVEYLTTDIRIYSRLCMGTMRFWFAQGETRQLIRLGMCAILAFLADHFSLEVEVLSDRVDKLLET
jgi:hypothetical protein